MISILKIGTTTFVLKNRLISDTSPIYMAEILHREEAEIPPVAIPLQTEFPPQVNVSPRIAKKSRVYTGSPNGKRKHLNLAMKRILRFDLSSENHRICVLYASIVRPHVGRTCHSSAMEFLKQNQFPRTNSMVYNLIAWAVTYCSLEVTDTYPMKYIKKEV